LTVKICSQALGPLVAGFAVQAEGWRWSSLELLWLSAPVAILMLLALPETSADTIILRRAQRLRRVTGQTDLRSASAIRQAEMHFRQIAYNALTKPWKINALDPAVLFSTVYMALAYGTFYSFFESFPLVFGDIYGFDLSSIGLAFVCALVGLLASTTLSLVYLRVIAPRRFARMKSVPPEEHLRLGLFASVLLPIGLFLFGTYTTAQY
jgi:DHA1 family multidrug resistance protein-like MFS transporter